MQKEQNYSMRGTRGCCRSDFAATTLPFQCKTREPVVSACPFKVQPASLRNTSEKRNRKQVETEAWTAQLPDSFPDRSWNHELDEAAAIGSRCKNEEFPDCCSWKESDSGTRSLASSVTSGQHRQLCIPTESLVLIQRKSWWLEPPLIIFLDCSPQQRL